jgi:hypothetical protein
MNVSSEPLTRMFPDPASAQQQLLTSSLCAVIATFLRSTERSYTSKDLSNLHDEASTRRLTKNFPIAASHDFISVRRETATEDTRIGIVRPCLAFKANRYLCRRRISHICHVHEWSLFVISAKVTDNGISILAMSISFLTMGKVINAKYLS